MIQALPAFNVSCPSCRSDFPVDPERVPARGIHAICSTCLRVFLVERPVDDQDLERSEGPSSAQVGTVGADDVADFEAQVVPASDAVVEDVLQAWDAGEVAGPPEAPALATSPAGSPAPLPPVEPATPVAATPPPLPPAPAAPPPQRRPVAIEDLTSLAQEAIAEGAGEGGRAQLAGSSLSLGADRFRKRGPQERAQRLARVLVSDIIAYYPARYRESFQRGTLKEDFQEEVRKSWKEYVDQVGEELAESTPYFGEALNEILGQGQQIF